MQIRHALPPRNKWISTNKKTTHDNYNRRQEWNHGEMISKLEPHFIFQSTDGPEDEIR